MLFNVYAAWIGIFLGCIAGATQGLFFHNEAWLGGYGSWRRRMLRLGHISFFGIAFLNLAFAATPLGDVRAETVWASRLLVAGAIGMPLVCYLSVIRDQFRHFFAVPVSAITAAAGLVLWRLFT